MKLKKFLKNNWITIMVVVLGIGLLTAFGTGLFAITASPEKSYEVGDMISGKLGFTGSATGADDGTALLTIEIKQIDGTWRTAWSDQVSRDLKISYTKQWPSGINGDCWESYGKIQCDSPGEWGIISAPRTPLTGYVEPGCYSYNPRLRTDDCRYYYRYGEGIAVAFTANDVQEDGTIIYRTVAAAEDRGASLNVGVSATWDLVPNPNPKECTPGEFDADLAEDRYRQCDSNGYWEEYTDCANNEELTFIEGSFACEMIVVEEPPQDTGDTGSNNGGTTGTSFRVTDYVTFDYSNNPVWATITTAVGILILALAIAFIPIGGKKK